MDVVACSLFFLGPRSETRDRDRTDGNYLFISTVWRVACGVWGVLGCGVWGVGVWSCSLLVTGYLSLVTATE